MTGTIEIVCPKCKAQTPNTFDGSSGRISVGCPRCKTAFDSELVRVRAKNSRGSRKQQTRDVNVRVWDLSGQEKMISFRSEGYEDFEMRSKDWVIFSGTNGRIGLVQNVTIGTFQTVPNNDVLRAVAAVVLIVGALVVVALCSGQGLTGCGQTKTAVPVNSPAATPSEPTSSPPRTTADVASDLEQAKNAAGAKYDNGPAARAAVKELWDLKARMETLRATGADAKTLQAANDRYAAAYNQHQAARSRAVAADPAVAPLQRELDEINAKAGKGAEADARYKQWVEIVRAERQAMKDAEAKHPAGSPEFAPVWHAALKSRKAEVIKRLGITEAQAKDLAIEASKKLWSMPNNEG